MDSTSITSILDELNLQHVAENFELYNVGPEDVRNLSDEIFEILGVHRIKDKCRLKQKCDEVLIGKLKPNIHDKRTYIEFKKVFGELNTAKLADKLTAECIGFEDVVYLSENDLKKIGVEDPGERRRIVRECERLMHEIEHEYDLIDHEEISDTMENDDTFRILMQEVEHEYDLVHHEDDTMENYDRRMLDDLLDDLFQSKGDSVNNQDYNTRICSDIENDDLLQPEEFNHRMSPEYGESGSQGFQTNVELGPNAKFENGDRGNNVKHNQLFTAETIGQIGGPSNTGRSPSSSNVKMEENAIYRAVRENNTIETEQIFEAHHIGNINGGEAGGKVNFEIGANSSVEINDSNNIIKSSQSRHIDIKVGDNVVLNGNFEKVDHDTKRVPPPLQFHSKHGRNIKLSPDQLTATRYDNADEGIDVFSSRPVCAEMIEVVVQDEVKVFDSISVGFTACNPENLIINELPDDSTFLMEREEYWVIKEEFCHELKKEDVLRLKLSSEGDVFYSKNNGTEILLMAVDVSCPIWIHFRLNGSVQEIKILGNNSPHNKEIESEPISVSSTPNTSRPISTPRPQHLVFAPITFHKNCGKNISLNYHRTTAKRNGNSSRDTYVFTARNIYPGEEIYLMINTGRVNDGLKFGVTVCNPEDLNIKELPNDSRCLADREEYWLNEKLLYKTSQEELTAHIRYTNDGYVLYSIDEQEEKLLFCVDTSVDLWAYFMLGHNQSIAIISKDSPEKKGRFIDRGNSDKETRHRPQNDNNGSNIVKDFFTSAISTAAGIGATVVSIPFAGLGAPLVGVATGAAVHSAIKQTDKLKQK